jgi:hypothetical protein
MWAKNIYDCYDPSDYAYCTCAIYSCGYSQPRRKNLSIYLLENGTAETDCSAGVSWWLFKGGFLDECPWFHTAIERDYLLDHGFTMFPFGSLPLKRNDVLWREGHTGLYIGEGLQAEALRDENHQAGYEGTIPGDNDDGETVVRDVTNDWTYVLRYVQDEKEDLKGLIGLTFLFTSGGAHYGHVYYYDGGKIFKCDTEEQKKAAMDAHRMATGKDLPFFHLENGDDFFKLIGA